MPELRGFLRRSDHPYWDTHRIEPGQRKLFFAQGRAAGNGPWRTNQLRGHMLNGDTFVVLAIGLRCLGATREQEEKILDHLYLQVFVGERPVYSNIAGPLMSMLRHVFSKEEIERYQIELDEYQTQAKPGEDVPRGTAPARVGYHLARPIIIPMRQTFGVEIAASTEMPRAVDLRCFLLGLETSEALQG